MKTSIVDFWATVFAGLRWVSVFQLVRTVLKSTRRSYFFVDAWVLGSLTLAIIALALSCPDSIFLFEAILLLYGGLRILETMVYQVNVLLFDEYRAKKKGQPYAIRGFRRVVILLLHNYIEIILWYALFYLNFNTSFDNGLVNLRTALQSVGFSFNAITTFGYASTAPVDRIGYTLVFSESAIGVFMALVVLARFISLIPSPETLDEFEKQD